ncbi:unnamed protein product [Porites lobata]|uniref:Fibronectin type-III domain-containing protein n=1 Tax=Porites lobata TaxID=104759 RepID=A0ABN8NE72_9CNID|nr:unnamed protein product [Porites lobata]
MTLSYYLVTDLQPCSEYEFKVQVLLWGMQPGPFSDTVKVKTTSVTTSPPRNIQHVSKGTDRIQITWETPVTYCLAVTSYKINYKEDTQLNFQSVVTGNVHSYLLTGLSPSITYDIKLQAHSTEDGDGQFSVLQSVRISIFRPTGMVA